MTYINPNDALVEAMARAIYNDGRGPRVTPFDQLAKGAKHYWYDRARAAAAVIADALAERDAEIARLRAALNAINKAVIDGRVCDDVAWFNTITTLHDFIQEVLYPSQPPVVCDLFDARAALGSAKV